MYISELKLEGVERSIINRIIFEGLDDDEQPGDIILVFGSTRASKWRVPKAVELYKAKRANTIVMTGAQSDPPEALIMKEAAIKMGVQKTDILLEDTSTNTKENILFTRELLDKRFGLANIKRILIVTNFFHLRRCLLTLKTHMPDSIQYSLCGVFDHNTRPDNWWTNEKGRVRVMGEMDRLIKYTSMGEIIDYQF